MTKVRFRGGSRKYTKGPPTAYRQRPTLFTSTVVREQRVSVAEFKQLLSAGLIRPASLDDVQGTHHRRPLYQHPNTHQWFVRKPENENG